MSLNLIMNYFFDTIVRYVLSINIRVKWYIENIMYISLYDYFLFVR